MQELSTDKKNMVWDFATFVEKNTNITVGPFKYHVIKEVGGWGQKMAIFDDLQ